MNSFIFGGQQLAKKCKTGAATEPSNDPYNWITNFNNFLTF